MSDPLDQEDAAPAGPGAAPPPPPPWLRALNDAQRQAVEALDGPILVLAGAGTGKTRVLTARLGYLLYLRRAHPYQVLAVTFTNKAAREMRGRIADLVGPAVEGIWLGTFHALATRILRRHAELVGLKSDFTILDADDQLRLLKQILEAEHVDDKRWPARMLMGAIQRFKDKGLTPDRLSPDDGGELANGRLIDIYKAYQDRLLTLNAADFGDLLMHCLTLFTGHEDVLRQYQRQFRYILVDEYQDTNVAQYLWLRLLAQGHKNICCVGDDDQCLAPDSPIAMADGSEKPIQTVKPGDLVLSNHGQGAFRPARVLRAAKRATNRPLVRIVMQSGRQILSTPEHTHFADIVHGDSPRKFYTYLMEKRGVGFRLGTSQTYTRARKSPVIGFRQRCLQEHADAVWLLDAFDTESDARECEHRLSLRYAITTFPFVARKGGGDKGLVHDQARLDRLHADLGSRDAAHRLLRDHGLDPAAPHHVPRSSRGRRKVLRITLNQDTRGTTPMHGIALSGNDPQDARTLRGLGLNPRAYKRNPRNWRFQTAFRDFARIDDIRARLEGAFDLDIVYTARLMKDRRALQMRRASEIRPGMVMVGIDGAPDVVSDVMHAPSTPFVYDLDIEGTHNFVAGGLVTHNSIYGWRGAEVGNILKFEKDFPGARVIRLERNYRSTGNILAAASGLIANNESRLGKTLWTEDAAGEPIEVRGLWDSEEEARWVCGEIEALQSKGHDPEEIAVLVRAGFQTREFEERLITLGIPYRVVGGPRFYEREEIRDAIAYLRLVRQPADDLAFERIANKPARGIGKTTLQSVHALARASGRPLYLCARELVGTDELKPAGRRALHAFVDKVELWRRMMDAAPLIELTETVLEESGYIDFWRASKKPEAPGKLENLKELLVAMAEFETLAAFLEHVSLVMDADRGGDGAMVSLMTLHAAKGLEFETVFLPGWEEGLFPHQRALDESGLKGLEEERRLAYVGLTRAKRAAFVSHAANRRMHGSWTSAIPSRFIDELPKDHVTIEGEEGLYAGRRDSWGFADRAGGGFGTGGGTGLAEPGYSGGGGPGWRRLRNRGVSKPVVIDARAELARDPDHGFGDGERCFHQKFGMGTVVAVDGDHLTIDFDHAGRKKLVASFVTRP